jgi:hypothetical protein
MKVVWVHSSKPSSRVVIAYLDSSIVLRIVLDSMLFLTVNQKWVTLMQYDSNVDT